MDRFFIYPTLQQFTDLVLFLSSIFILNWYETEIKRGLSTEPKLDDTEFRMRIIANFNDNIDYPFQYMFATNVICLIVRISVIL